MPYSAGKDAALSRTHMLGSTKRVAFCILQEECSRVTCTHSPANDPTTKAAPTTSSTTPEIPCGSNGDGVT